MQTLKVFRNAKRWIVLKNNPILHPIVHFIIKMDWFNNRGKFKPGDKVKYNLFAKIYIGGIEEIKGGKSGTIYTISHYEPWSKKLENVAFIENSGCSVFWIRKLYPWERWRISKNFSFTERN